MYRERRLGYSLIGHEPIAFDDLLTWAESFEMLRRRGANIVAQDYVGSVLVSTVFLGTDMAWSGPPLLFETMTFGKDADVQDRYSTWEEAEAGHRKVIAWLQANLVKAGN